MAKRARRSRKQVLAADLMLAPAVMALRMPTLIAEAMDRNSRRDETLRATTEKLAAAAEGAVAAQLSLAQSASQFWLEVMAGRTPALLSGAAAERALHAALKPAGGRVRRNFRRLSKPKR